MYRLSGLAMVIVLVGVEVALGVTLGAMPERQIPLDWRVAEIVIASAAWVALMTARREP